MTKQDLRDRVDRKRLYAAAKAADNAREQRRQGEMTDKELAVLREIRHSVPLASELCPEAVEIADKLVSMELATRDRYTLYALTPAGREALAAAEEETA